MLLDSLFRYLDSLGTRPRAKRSRRRPGCRGWRRSQPLAVEILEARTVPSGFHEFELPYPSAPFGITAGPDGNLWIAEQADKIGRITPAGTITEFFQGITPNSWPSGITAGPDGNLWFTENGASKIGRITPAGTLLNQFSTPTASSAPIGI